MPPKHERCSHREPRHLKYILQISTDIRHIADLNNLKADTLTQVEINFLSSLPSINCVDMTTVRAIEDPSLPQVDFSSWC